MQRGETGPGPAGKPHPHPDTHTGTPGATGPARGGSRPLPAPCSPPAASCSPSTRCSAPILHTLQAEARVPPPDGWSAPRPCGSVPALAESYRVTEIHSPGLGASRAPGPGTPGGPTATGVAPGVAALRDQVAALLVLLLQDPRGQHSPVGHAGRLGRGPGPGRAGPGCGFLSLGPWVWLSPPEPGPCLSTVGTVQRSKRDPFCIPKCQVTFRMTQSHAVLSLCVQ